MSPTNKSLKKTSSLGSMSFARCFGASAPISPRASKGHRGIEHTTGMSYRKLGFDEDDEGEDDNEGKEDEDSEHEHAYTCGPEHLGKEEVSKVIKEVKSKGVLKTSCINLRAPSPARVHGISSPSPSPTSNRPVKMAFGAKVREAFVQVLETVHRSSSHMSELFVGNQLLMQVTSSSTCAHVRRGRNVMPSPGFLAVTQDHTATSLSSAINSASHGFLSPAHH